MSGSESDPISSFVTGSTANWKSDVDGARTAGESLEPGDWGCSWRPLPTSVVGLEPKIGTVTATPVGMVVLAEVDLVKDDVMLVETLVMLLVALDREVVGTEMLGLVTRVVAEVLEDGVPVDPPVVSVTETKPGKMPSPMYSW